MHFFGWCFVLFSYTFIHSFIYSFTFLFFLCPIAQTHVYATIQIGLAMVAISTLVISGIVSYTALCVTAWGYGLAFGCYRYTLKMLALERVRAKHFTKAWGKCAYLYLTHLQNPNHLPHCTTLIEAFFPSTAHNLTLVGNVFKIRS